MKYNVDENKVTGMKTIYVHLKDGESPQKQVAGPQNNDKINSVQFVIKTASIEKEETEEESEPVEEKKGFWAKLKDLFF